jgi:aminotransferase
MSRQAIANHVLNVPKSGIRDFFEIVQTMKDVISLGIGEPDFVTPWHIRAKAIQALETGKTGYTSNLGTLALRQEIASNAKRRFDISYNPKSEILVTVGVSEALDLALRALINPGDEVIYHEPCYVSYNPSIVMAHGVPVAVATQAENHFALKAEDLEKKITSKTKAILLNFPTNPTGAILPRSEQEKIANLCKKHDVILIADEIYAELTYLGQHQSIASLPDMKERTIFLHGLSKAYAMTGFRIGYACSTESIIDAMMKIHQYAILCAPIISQEAAVEALAHGDDEVEQMRKQYQLRRNFLVQSFNQMGLDCVEPQGAFYVFPSIRSSKLSSRDFAMRLLEKKKVAVVPGNAFGPSGEGYVRCSYATSMNQLQSAVEKIEQFLKEL